MIDPNFASESSSFRDNSNLIIYKDNEPYRLIFQPGIAQFNKAENSGLIKSLQEKQWLIDHTIIKPESLDLSPELKNKTACILKPSKIPFISYPYEWSFEQLKDAAILTLKIQLHCLEKGVSLKDASAYNIQFIGSRPTFIDSNSFEVYEEGKPWVAYKQFCKHFLGPLLAYKYTNASLAQQLSLFIDGAELETISKLLPFKTKFSPYILTHIHWHSKMETRYQRDKERSLSLVDKKISLNNLKAFIGYLLSGIESLQIEKNTGVWGDYYLNTQNYKDNELLIKKQTICNWGEKINPNLSFDLGCNTGLYSDVLSLFSKQTVAIDIEHDCINEYYLKLKKEKQSTVLPLNIDLSMPSPAIGWANEERRSFTERFQSDYTVALALIHHLCLGNNIPLPKLANWFSECTSKLAIEFVPKTDPQAQRLLITKKDIFNDYTFDNFVMEFTKHFSLHEQQLLTESGRILCLFKKA